MKHSNFNLLLIALLGVQPENVCAKEQNEKKETKTTTQVKIAKAVNPLKQSDILDLAEFTEIYPPAIDKNGNVQTEPILSKVTKKGNGPKAIKGETLTVHYTGCLPATMESTKTMLHRAQLEKKSTITVGYKFDSSIDRGQAFQFKLGAGQVISGWDIVLSEMKVGEKRIVILPAKQAYGARATGKIPSNATLIFEIELIAAS